MSKVDLKKLFPLNQIIVAETLGLLCMLIGSYYVIAVILYELARVLQLIYLVGRIFLAVEFLVKIYCFCGIVIGCYQYLIRNVYTQTEFINPDELRKFTGNNLYRTIIIAIVVLYCLQLVFHKENPKRSQQDAEEVVQSDSAVHDEFVLQEKQEVTKNETREVAKNETREIVESETQTDEEAEKERMMRQNQLELYEDIKGFWKGSGVQYQFSRTNDKYCFFDSNSLGDVYTNAEFHIAYYDVDSYEKKDHEVKAVIYDREGTVYDLELTLDTGSGRRLKIKKNVDDEWIELTDNTCFSYQDILEAGEYKAVWMKRGNGGYRSGMRINIEKDAEYCFLDVTEQYEGDEMIVCYESDSQSHSYYVLGIRDGYVQPLYDFLSFLNMECYDAENRILWSFYYGGTAGGSRYTRMIYDEEHDGWMEEDRDEVSGDCVKLSLEKMP